MDCNYVIAELMVIERRRQVLQLQPLEAERGKGRLDQGFGGEVHSLSRDAHLCNALIGS